MTISNYAITSLSMASFDLITRFTKKHSKNGDSFDVDLFCRTILTQFPCLEKLILMCYVKDNGSIQKHVMNSLAKLYNVERPEQMPVKVSLEFQMAEFHKFHKFENL